MGFFHCRSIYDGKSRICGLDSNVLCQGFLGSISGIISLPWNGPLIFGKRHAKHKYVIT